MQSVTQSLRSDGGQTVADLRIAGTNTLLSPSSGELAGLLNARDTMLPAFLNDLNQFADTLISGFNQVYASGQGLSGYTTATSEFAVNDPNQALNATGLAFPPTQRIVPGARHQPGHRFDADQQHQRQSQRFHRTDTTLAQLAAALNGVNGISASIGSDNRLTIASHLAQREFSFANDSSGVLTALGINTFFSGTTALDIGVNPDVLNNPSLFAASQGGIGADTNNAVQLSQFPNQSLASQNGNTLTDLYNNMVNNVTQGSAQAQSTAASADAYAQSLSNQQLATSGVSIDEETIKMMSYQADYQATAHYISTLESLLQLLTQI